MKHNSFSNVRDEHHNAIIALTIDFLRAVLLGDRAAWAWFEKPGAKSIGRDQLTLERK